MDCPEHFYPAKGCKQCPGYYLDVMEKNTDFNKIALEDYVIVKAITTERKSAGGIVVPDMGSTPERRALVVAVGPGTYTQDGKFHPVNLEPGDTIYYSSVDLSVLVGSETYLVIRASRVFMRDPR